MSMRNQKCGGVGGSGPFGISKIGHIGLLGR